IHYLFKEYESDVEAIVRGKEKTKDLARLFSQKVVEHGKKVLDTPMPLVQVNMARVLARTADLGHPELADALVEIVGDARYNDGVKYYALQGLRNLLARTTNPTQFLTPPREEKVAQALIAFIKRKVGISPITPPDELEGMRVIRREAVRALA